MKKILSAIALALSLVLTAPVVLPQTAVVAEAATKTTIGYYGDTIGVNDTMQIELCDKQSKASYTYSSSKKSVATVSSKGVVTGKAAGKAKITVKQKYKGKTTTVGSFTITVKKSALYEYLLDEEESWWFSAQPGWISKSNPAVINAEDIVRYRNPKAKYTFSSSSKDLVISKTGKVTEVKNSGLVYVTVKETYKGKTRTVGKMPVRLIAPTYIGEDTVTLYVGSYGFYPIEYTSGLGMYGFNWSETERTDEELLKESNDETESADDDVLSIDSKDSEGNWDGCVSAKAAGTRYCALLQYNYITKKYDKVIGRFKIVVPDTSKVTELILPWEKEDYYGSYNKETKMLEVDKSWDSYNYLTLSTNPEHYSGTYEVTSSDPKVVTAKMSSEESYGAELYLEYLSVGKATITVKVNGAEKSFVVNVTDSDVYDDDDDDDEW